MTRRIAPPVLFLAALALAGCTGPPAARRPAQSTGPPPAAGREAPADMGWGVMGAVLPGGLQIRVRREDSAPAVTLVLAVPAGRSHGPAALALGELWSQPLMMKARALGGVGGVEVGGDLTLFRVSVPTTRWREALSLVLGCLGPPPGGGERLQRAVVAARAGVGPRTPSFEWSLDPEAVLDSLYRPGPGGRGPALAVVGPVEAAAVRREAGRRVPDLSAASAPTEEAEPYQALPADGGPPRLALGLPAAHPLASEGAATSVLARLLDGPSGGPIARWAGALSLGAAHLAGPQGGLLVLEAEAAGELVETAHGLVDALQESEDRSPDPGAVAGAAADLRLDILVDLALSPSRARLLAGQAALGLEDLPPDRLAALDALTPRQVAASGAVIHGTTPYLLTWGERRPSPAEFESLKARWEEGGAPVLAAPAVTLRRGRPEPPGPVEKRPLAQGAELVFQPDRNLPLAAAAMRFPGGRVQEGSDGAGATRLLVEAAVEALVAPAGLRVTGTAGPDSYGFDLLGDPSAFEEAGAALLRALRNPAPSSIIDRARRRLLEEAARRLSRPAEQAADLLRSAAYPGHPYGHPPDGLPGVVSGIGREALVRWSDRLGRGRWAVALVGDLEGAQARRIAGRWDEIEAALRPPGSPRQPVPAPPALRRRPGASRLTTQALGFRTGGRTDPLHPAYGVLENLLAQPDGPLEEALAEVGARVQVAYVAWDLGGLFTILLVSPAGLQEEARLRALQALQRLAADPPGPSPVREAAASAATLARLAAEGPAARAALLAGEALRRRPMAPAEEAGASRLDRVGKGEVEEALDRLVAGEGPCIGMVEGFREGAPPPDPPRSP